LFVSLFFFLLLFYAVCLFLLWPSSSSFLFALFVILYFTFIFYPFTCSSSCAIIYDIFSVLLFFHFVSIHLFSHFLSYYSFSFNSFLTLYPLIIFRPVFLPPSPFCVFFAVSLSTFSSYFCFPSLFALQRDTNHNLVQWYKYAYTCVRIVWRWIRVP
jgi:hypothetical protein